MWDSAVGVLTDQETSRPLHKNNLAFKTWFNKWLLVVLIVCLFDRL